MVCWLSLEFDVNRSKCQSGGTAEMAKGSGKRVVYLHDIICVGFLFNLIAVIFVDFIDIFRLILVPHFFLSLSALLPFPTKRYNNMLLDVSIRKQSKWNDLNEIARFLNSMAPKKARACTNTAWFGFGVSSRVIDIVLIFRTIAILSDEFHAYFVCVCFTFGEDTFNMFECSPQKFPRNVIRIKAANRTESNMFDPWSNTIVDTPLIFYRFIHIYIFPSVCFLLTTFVYNSMYKIGTKIKLCELSLALIVTIRFICHWFMWPKLPNIFHTFNVCCCCSKLLKIMHIVFILIYDT